MTPLLELSGITKSFGAVDVIRGVDLTIQKGEFVVFVGASGSGKSTLLRMVAGLETVSGGDILIDGRDVTFDEPSERGIAMVFQSYALYPHMTVFKNIAFPLRTRGVEKNAIQEKVEWAAKMFSIEKLLKRKPRELSGGERQRVALARAMVRQPKVFLLDEPLSNLDAKLRTAAREELRQFQRNIGITTIYVTHDQVEAMGLGDRIVVMNKGTIRQVGKPHEVYQEPADIFVATFLGSPPMNLVEKDNVLMGFRPESFLPREVFGDNGGLECFQFAVTWLEDLGAERLVYGDVGLPCPHRHVISKIAASTPKALEPGKTYPFAVKTQDLRYFYKGTGGRIKGGGA